MKDRKGNGTVGTQVQYTKYFHKKILSNELP